jgi:hypothetical protein
MSTKKKNTSSKGTRKKSPEIENLDQYVNNFDWVTIPNTRESKSLVSPIEIEDNDMFIYFFKRFLMQPQIRKHFIYKYRPTTDYYLVKLDYNDPHFSQKVKFIERKMKVKDQDYIIDIAEQLKEGGGGHWTSLKRENGRLEYMDPDPFYYGSGSNAFHKLVKNLPNPIEIYGDTNKNRSQYRANKSIQNLHKRDTFCQSWSLFFLTVSNMYPDNSERIRFQLKTPVTHQDTDAQYKNFPDFFNNFIFLLDVWIAMIQDDVDLERIVEGCQWENWNATDLVEKLGEIKTDFLKKEKIIKKDVEMQHDLFCLHKDAISSYMIKIKI